MANITIDGLPAASSVSSSDTFPVRQGGTTTRRATGAQIAAMASAAAFVFTQASASAHWTIAHNLHCYPSVRVLTAGGAQVIPEVQYTSTDVVDIYFSSPLAGSASLS